MKIGVDMDGVIADLTPRLIDFHNATYQTAFSLNDHTVYDLTKIWQCSEEEVIKRIHQFYRSLFFKKVAPLPDTLMGIKNLSQRHSLVLITSRPHFIEQHSQAWLQQYFPKYFSKIVHTNQITHKHEQRKKKSEICQEEKVEIMIEDALEYATDCAINGVKVLLFNTSWNQSKRLHKNIKRVFGWKGIIKSI